MIDAEFVLPNKVEDLCGLSSIQYVVTEVSSVRDIAGELLGFRQALCEEGVEFIFKNFDVYYSLLRHFNEVDAETKLEAYDILLDAAGQLANELTVLLEDENELCEAGVKFKFRNLLKMCLYLLCQLAEAYETEILKPSTVVTETKRGRKKQKVATSNETGWDVKRRDFVKCVDQIYRFSINKLWDPPVVELEFVNMVTLSFFKLLENKEVVDNDELSADIYDFLGFSLKTYKSDLGYSIKLIQLSQDFATLVPSLSSAVNLFISKYEARNLITDIFKEMTCIDSEDMVRDTARMHSLSQFLIELAEKCPDEVVTSVKFILPCLEEESHIMRNCVLSIIGEVLQKISNIKDITESMASLRDQLSHRILDHVHDVNAFVRCKSLQIAAVLLEKGAIPLSQHLSFLEVAIGRMMKDKTSTVRRSAVLFLKTFVLVNPYCAQLSLEELKESFEKEDAALKEMMSTFLNNGKRRAVHFDSDDDECEDITNKEIIPDNIVADEENNVEGKDANPAVEEPRPDETSTESSPKSKMAEDQPNNDEEDIAKKQCLVQYLKCQVEYVELIKKALPSVCVLLKSCTMSDVIEAIDFFTTAFQLGMQDAVLGIKEMMSLVFSKEPSIKNAVVTAYKKLYLTVEDEERSVAASLISKNMILFLYGASETEVLAIEGFVKEFVRSGDITNDVLEALWETFAQKSASTTEEESLYSLLLLTMAASVDIDILTKNIHRLVSVGLGSRADNNFQLAKATCTALIKINTPASSTTSNERSVQFRLPQSHVVFNRISNILINGVTNLKDCEWSSMAEKAVGAIFKLADHPEAISKIIVQKITQKLHISIQGGNQEKANSSGIFCRLLFLCGHIVYWHVIFFESDLFNELRRREFIKRRKVPKRRPLQRRYSQTPSTRKTDDETTETGEMQEAEIDDLISEFISKISENEILSEHNMLGYAYSLVVKTCKWSLKSFHQDICAAASLSLAKFMSVSSQVCEEHMQLIVTMMENCPEADIRSNIIIAVADLITRFPNEVEPWTPNLYKRLRDQSSSVRMNAIVVLTHLILHDMVKVKGQISEIAICIVDEKIEISNVAKYLFQELAKKKNALYNILPDLISGLSDTNIQLSEENFQTIIKFIFQFIEKDRHIEGMVEKLCLRLKDANSPIQVHEIAYSLSLFNFNEKCFQKMIESKASFKSKTDDDVLAKCVKDIANNLRKSTPKLECEIDAFLEELHI